MKKLSNKKVHWASTVVYVCWPGIPLSLILSFFLYYYGLYHQDFQSEIKDIPMDLYYSILSALLSLAGQIFLAQAFIYEDATKIAITKTVDVFFTCCLQYLLLGVVIDFFAIIGSSSILSATISILVFKILENEYASYKTRKLERQEKLNDIELSKGGQVNESRLTKRDYLLKLIFFKL